MTDTTSHLPVFVTGVIGEIGSKLLPLLEHHSVPAKIASRSQKQVDTFHEEGFNAILADLSEYGPWIVGGVGVIASLGIALFWRRR